jgi:glucose 1-dehydrogenase
METRTALVTGASKGVGKGIALELARCGCAVVVNYNSDAAGAEAAAAQIRCMGRQALVTRANVGVAADVDRMFAEVVARRVLSFTGWASTFPPR